MSAQVIVTCPHCGFNRTVPQESIPRGTTSGTCPRCRQAFDLTPLTMALQLPPEETAAPPPRPKPQPRTLAFAFHGTANDYFGIWIVNTLLKLMSLGAYTAWAKVRQRRFFYGNTTLQDEPFEYLADPLALFKGWLIGAAAFLLYMLGSRVSPLLSMVIGVALFLAVPWLVVRSRLFNARNTSHRNIRFNFQPAYRQAYLVFAGLPILTLFTLGLLTPYVLFRQRKFLVENSAYGTTPFTFNATPQEFYRLVAKAALAFVLLVVAGGGLFFLLGGSGLFGAARAAGEAREKLGPLALVPMLSFVLAYFLLVTYLQTALTNLTWNSTTIAGNRFRSTLRARDMAWIYLSNLLAIAASVGLLMPWATVRLARYRFQRLNLATSGGVDAFLAATQDSAVGAAGEEIGDIFGITVDVGL
jgi:uncharacterized membrane protein YjgN (DUF898 family)